jgi:hypothetical protein
VDGVQEFEWQVEILESGFALDGFDDELRRVPWR